MNGNLEGESSIGTGKRGNAGCLIRVLWERVVPAQPFASLFPEALRCRELLAVFIFQEVPRTWFNTDSVIFVSKVSY